MLIFLGVPTGCTGVVCYFFSVTSILPKSILAADKTSWLISSYHPIREGSKEEAMPSHKNIFEK